MPKLNQTCVTAGVGNPDIAGTGVLMAFSAQAFISIVQAIYYMKISRGGSLILYDVDDNNIHSLGLSLVSRSKKLILMNDIMLSLSDGQTILGVALLLAALVQIESLGLYHLHLVYDTASFTAISFWVTFSAACGYKKTLTGQLKPVTNPFRRRARLLVVLLYTTMHLIYASQFIYQLSSWNDFLPGKCYNAALLTGSSSHPVADQIYILLTTFILVICLAAMSIYLFIMEIEESKGKINPRFVVPFMGMSVKFLTLMGLCTAVTMFPLHVYMMAAARWSNQRLLVNGGDNENQWGFGQSVAVIMLVVSLRDCGCGWLEYWAWKREDQRGGVENEGIEKNLVT